MTATWYQSEQTRHRMPFNAVHQHVHTALNIREQACRGRSRQHAPSVVRTVLVSCRSVAFTQKRHLLEKPTVRSKASGQPKRPRCAWCHRTDNASKICETHATKQSIGTTHVTRLANPQRTSREDDEGLLRRSTNADIITMVAWRIEPAFLAHMEARTTGILQTKTTIQLI